MFLNSGGAWKATSDFSRFIVITNQFWGTVKTRKKNKWIKNTRAEIWSKKYHIHKNTFSLKNENCSYIKELAAS